MASVETPPTEVAGVAKRPRAEPPAFPGCKPVRLPRTEIDRFEGRLEYWDSATETAWICEPTTPYHERPSRLLTRLAELIGRVRGSPIESYGSMDLMLRDASGEPRRIMQADESVYLHPAQARLPGPRPWWSARMTFPTWCWRWITPPTYAAANSRCTNPGAFRKCGWTFLTRRRRAGRGGVARG